jgi:phosphohistidine swiveling domain-containing protein
VDRERIWSRRIADELWSGVVTPLTFTMLADVMAEHMVRRRLENAGLHRLAAEPVFRLSHGHVYVNASLVADVMAEVPAVFLSEGLLELLPEGLRGGVRSAARSVASPTLATILLNLALHERGWMPWSRAAVFRDAARQIGPQLARLELPADASREAIAKTIAAVRAHLAGFLEAVSWGMIYAYVFFHLTTQLLARWAPDAAASTTGLTTGLDGIWTFAIHDEVVACAALARSDADLRAAVSGDPDAVAARCLRGELGTFGARVVGLLQRHGHRLIGRDLSYPTWRERPAVVVETVQKLLEVDAPESVAQRRARHAATLRRVSERVGAGFAGTLRRIAFERSFAWCEEYYVLRENMRYHADLFLSALRALALEAASRLVASGELGRREDVFYLEAAELEETLLGRAIAGEPLASRAARRRREYESLAVGEAPESLSADALGDVRDALAESPGELAPAHSRVREVSGLGVSPGRTAGPARVVQSVEDLKSLRAGEVIVAASTDPSWTSLLALGGALVLEMGGVLSHGAIVARELGIPAVVNVAHATRIFATGDHVVVDGRTGTVVLA